MAAATERICVVIPVKDEAFLLDRCLRALSRQTLRPCATVVVDNGSDDPSSIRAVAQRYGASVVVERVPGIPAANSTGNDHATGTIIARLDADCVPPETWLADIMRAFERDADVVAITGPAVFVDGPPLLRRPLAAVYVQGYRLLVGAALAQTPLFGSNCAIRVATWREIAHSVHRDDRELHDDLDVTVHLGLERRTRFDPDIMMGISMRPFSDGSSLARRIRRGWRTLKIHWPAESPMSRWRRRTRRALARSRRAGRRATAGARA